MYNRIVAAGMNITRYSLDIARYTMIKHKKDKPSKDRFKNVTQGPRLFRADGLNNLK